MPSYDHKVPANISQRNKLILLLRPEDLDIKPAIHYSKDLLSGAAQSTALNKLLRPEPEGSKQL